MTTRRQLEQQRTRYLRSAPDLTQLLRGSLFERRTRCGKPSCHCATGQGHLVVCVGVTLPGGKNIQVTVPPELAPVVRHWTENYKKLWQLIEGVSANRELLRRRLVDATAATAVRQRRSRRSPGGGV
jgi:hypothetical protein